MNKLHLPGTVWVASDLHLSDATPATTANVLAFLDQAATHADSLLLPGDIFDVWIGDDLAIRQPPAWLVPILDSLLAASRHLDLYLGRGNRDFLMGPALAHRVGARLLDDRVCLQTDYGAILLSHGDEYCTADAGYQRFRRLVRTPWIQRAFLTLGLGVRRRIADLARRRSRHSNHYKSQTIMDVTPEAVHAALRDSGCPVMVHGHTHRPGTHRIALDGEDRWRYVLPDWDYDHDADGGRGGWLEITRDGITLRPWAAIVLS